MVVLGLYLSGGGVMSRQPVPRERVSCPSCGYAVRVKVQSLKVRPLRRCPRCGRGHVPAAQSAHTVDAETLEDIRTLIDLLHETTHGSPEAGAIIRQLDELIEEGNH